MNNADFIGLAEEYATNDQLTMQVGDIVRCKDCKHYDDNWCDRLAIALYDYFDMVFFCAHGERKDDE